jgi:hypothetical protein
MIMRNDSTMMFLTTSTCLDAPPSLTDCKYDVEYNRCDTEELVCKVSDDFVAGFDGKVAITLGKLTWKT